MRGILAFAPEFNTKGRKDATGAFQPEAEAFKKAHLGDSKVRIVWIDNLHPAKEMVESVLIEILNFSKTVGTNLDAVAFFCHGSSKGIQFGFDRSNVKRLATTLAGAAWHPSAVVALYACLAGNAPGDPVGGDGGFADLLRDELCRVGSVQCRVDAHTTAGHSTQNPFVRRFEGMGSPVGGAGGYDIVSYGSKLWKAWKTAVKSDNKVKSSLFTPMPMRFLFPFLTTGEIHAALVG